MDGRLPSPHRSCPYRRVKQRGERFRQVETDGAVLVDVDLVEEGLVELAANGRRCLQIGGVAVAEVRDARFGGWPGRGRIR
jgi:hypothetical protein